MRLMWLQNISYVSGEIFQLGCCDQHCSMTDLVKPLLVLGLGLFKAVRLELLPLELLDGLQSLLVQVSSLGRILELQSSTGSCACVCNV